jgi:hypothetical protein
MSLLQFSDKLLFAGKVIVGVCLFIMVVATYLQYRQNKYQRRFQKRESTGFKK